MVSCKQRRSVFLPFVILWLSACASAPSDQSSARKIALMSKASESIAGYKAKIRAREGREAGAVSLQRDVSESQMAYVSVLDVCAETLGKFEHRGRIIQYSRVAAVVIGSFAGSIAIPILAASAPAANAAWITGLGAISGLTNATQSSISEQGLSSETSFEDRRLVLERAREALAKYYGSTGAEKATALEQLAAACTMYDITASLKPTIAE